MIGRNVPTVNINLTYVKIVGFSVLEQTNVNFGVVII